MTRTIPLLVAVTLAGSGGCSSAGNVNLGGNQNPGGTMAALAGTWSGYAEATMFQPSGTDQVRFVIDAQGNGTVQVGDDPLLPAPTDPNVGFPPSASGDAGAYSGASLESLWGGVLYPMHAAQFAADAAAGRIQFGLTPSDFYAAWCALQTPNHIVTACMGPSGQQGTPPGGYGGQGGTIQGPTVEYGYSISPGIPWDSYAQNGTLVCNARIYAADCTYTEVPIDCGKFALTTGDVCTCTAASCTSGLGLPPGPLSTYLIEFDGLLDSSGKSLTGTLINYSTSSAVRTTIHLTRQ